MSTVSIGSNRTYAENWEGIFKKGKAAQKKAAPMKEKGPSQKSASNKKKGKPAKAARKPAKRKG